MGTPNKNDRFVVGVDFGTTFTSVAFAHTASPEEVKLVQTWPNGGIGNASADQVPTEVHYTNPITRAKIWGYETSTINKGASSPDPLKWFKLLLQDRPTAPIGAQSALTYSRKGKGRASGSGFESLFGGLGISSSLGLSTTFTPPTYTPAQKTALKLQQANISPVTVVTDFLSAVRETTIASIERTYDPTWVRENKKEYVLTVPAIWSDAAKSLMVQAAQDAGFGTHRVDFSLISEPEAAASHTLKAIQPNNLNCGDTFIICDAGGGTVDLISYKIVGLDPLQIDESVSGSGDMCGSVFLDERFEEYIRRVLGDRVIDGMKPRSRNEMFRTWEEKVKYKFGNINNHEGFEITVAGVPDDESKNVEDGFHTIPSGEVKKIFDPIVDCIVRLVKQQVTDVHRKGEKVAAILLVGGFGSSEYLCKQLQIANYGTGGPIQVLQPTNARTAIARGALLRGLDGSIVNKRRSRLNYGCISSTFYQAGKGWDAHKYWESSDDKYLVDGHLNWYITRNQVIEGEESTSIPFYRMVPVPLVPGHQPWLMFTDELLACDLDDAPDFKWKNPGSIYRICTLPSDLSGIPLRKFSKYTNSLGVQYYRIDFELQISRVDEVMKFELLFEGESRGEVSAKMVVG
ncbi:hypothetical protein K440DRAFT_611241 [Wilcoxina mikolae CBS 423.85]|nr:hypothetical protein K440DRAFT_611241 [Wilcoxina mikolae CBS 423.85]